MSRDQKDTLAIIALVLVPLVVFAVIAIGIYRQHTQCEAKGGVLVRATFERVCIKADVIELD